MPKGRGTVRIYTVDTDCVNRSHADTLKHGKIAERTKRVVLGVKGISILTLVPQFDVITGFNLEYMHSVLLGVVRQFAYLWLDSSSSRRDYYLGNKVELLDKMIMNVKPPAEIKRLPRSLTTRRFWKAAEWRSFLLFYTPIFLKGLSPTAFYDHWLLISYAVYTLLNDNISGEDILLAEIALYKFAALVATLYGNEHISYNVHLLVHLAKSVKLWGPLWANSAFLFENANGKLLRSFSGTRGVTTQIFKLFLSTCCLGNLAEKHIDGSSDSIVTCYQQLTHTNL